CDLKRTADGLRIGSQRLALSDRGPAKKSAGVDRKLDQGPSLQGLNINNAVLVLGLALCFEVEHLSTCHALPARGSCQPEHKFCTDRGVGMGRRPAQNLEGESE